MKTKTITIYEFNELDERAKERVFDNFREGHEYPWHTENMATLKAFEKIFPVRVKGYEYGYRYSIDAEYQIEDEVNELRHIRLMKYILNNYGRDLFKPKYLKWIKGEAKHSRIQKETDCVLTGYCIDDDLLDPIYNFLKKPDRHSSLQDILHDCLQCFILACHKDHEYVYSDEAITEDILSNEYMFDEGGNIV